MTGLFLPDGVFRSNILFGPGDADRFGRPDPCVLLWHMQEIAGAHYEALCLGAALVASHGCFWAVTRTDLELTGTLPLGTELCLDTWSGRFGHGLYRRHYRLTDASGGVLARALSVWVLMDAQTRQLAADRSWLPDPAVLTQAGELAGARRQLFPEPDRSRTRSVQPGEIDRNDHLNNTLYLRWAAELLPEAFAARHTLRSLWVEYKKELTLGQTAELAYTLSGGTLFLRGTAEGRDAFRMRCDYDTI